MKLDKETVPLKTYNIIQKKIGRKDEYVARIQRLYLNDVDDRGPRNLQETLTQLEHFGYLLPRDLTNDEIQLLTWAAVGLEEIYKIFNDEQISEAFCNEIGTQIVVSHRIQGRCLTNLIFSNDLWNAIRTRAEFDTGRVLMPMSPALKTSFTSQLGNLRLSLQVPPLTPASPAFSIRRLPFQPITLESLIQEGQISSYYTQILRKALNERKNIIIAGEPGSGKTTLANALLLESDPSWRLIVIEDAREIQISTVQFPMITRFSMPSVGENDRYRKRADEIARLLHRSPDYVFLGELQNKEDTEVAFEGFAAGIHGMATTHSRGIDELLIRWTRSHNIGNNLLEIIDFIVCTEREINHGNIKMRVKSIYFRKDTQFVEVEK